MEEFFTLYHEVFDENGYVKLCGREKCKALIAKSQELDSTYDYGDLNTGFMNIQNITKLYLKLGGN